MTRNIYRNEEEQQRIALFEAKLPVIPESWKMGTQGVKRLNDYRADGIYAVVYLGPNARLTVTMDPDESVLARLVYGNGRVPTRLEAENLFKKLWPNGGEYVDHEDYKAFKPA